MLMVSASYAQQNYYFWEKKGKVSIEPVQQVDSLSFKVDSKIFQFLESGSVSATTNSFHGTVSVILDEKVKSIDETLEIGICYSDENSIPTYIDCKKVIGNSLQEYSFTINSLIPGTTYYYRIYVKLLNDVFYSGVNSVTIKGEKPEKPEDIIINGHSFVNLGLSSGLLWARSNVGAYTPFDDGEYFAWGETEPKEIYSRSTYKWGSDESNLSKYNSTDGKTILDPEDDVATVRWGTSCRIPSSSEFEELQKECIWSWQRDYQGANGYLVIGKNGNAIFFPASGNRYHGELDDHGSRGSYWLCSRGKYSPSYFWFTGGNITLSGTSYYNGFSVRPVANR